MPLQSVKFLNTRFWIFSTCVCDFSAQHIYIYMGSVFAHLILPVLHSLEGSAYDI